MSPDNPWKAWVGTLGNVPLGDVPLGDVPLGDSRVWWTVVVGGQSLAKGAAKQLNRWSPIVTSRRCILNQRGDAED
ncbi:MAG: hypothetical protein GY904_35710 [Planctomycetaceae bacterium]|nr:hypothetical protein [Planctomycetaceae bacterium]